jgi:hypothetical protein
MHDITPPLPIVNPPVDDRRQRLVAMRKAERQIAGLMRGLQT